MKLEKLAAIAEIVSSVAIVATLAYLAVQAQQANNMLLSISRQATLETDAALLTNMLNNPDVAARILGGDAETMQNSVMLIGLMRTREYQWLQYQNGTLDRETLESYMGAIDGWLLSDFGAAWWAVSQRQFNPEFAEFVNAHLERSPR